MSSKNGPWLKILQKEKKGGEIEFLKSFAITGLGPAFQKKKKKKKEKEKKKQVH